MFPMKIARFFRRGLLRYMMLDLINERPIHGYEIMKHFQHEFNGMYQPSSGAIYPILQAFEKQGYVNVEEINGKKACFSTFSRATNFFAVLKLIGLSKCLYERPKNQPSFLRFLYM